MSNITQWIKNELYPALFEQIDTALPEFNFKRRGPNWISSNKLKITGEEGESIGKVYVWEKAPGLLKDYTRGNTSVIDYVIKRDGAEFIQAVETLAKTAGLKLPKGEIDEEAYKRHRDKVNVLEEANGWFIYCLEHATGSEQVRSYLSTRGYTPEEVKAMELGFIPSQDKLYKHLQTKGYSEEQIKEALRLHPDIGKTNILTIPYRSGGQLKGFTIRAIGPANQKYIISTGMKSGEAFFNIKAGKADKDLLIVEGALDALACEVKGMENVAALGGSSITTEQIQDAIRKGYKSLTLCLDTDKAGAGGTIKAIEIILAEGVNRVYLVTLPEIDGKKTDPDSFIKERGIEAFKQVLSQATVYYKFWLEQIIKPYNAIIEATGGLTDKQVHSLEEEIVTAGAKITEPLDKDNFKGIVIQHLGGLGITEESLAITLDRLTSTRDKEQQAKEFKRLITDAKTLEDKGDVAGALDLLDSKVKEVRLKDKATEFSYLMKPATEEEIKQRQASRLDSISSGYVIGDEELLLPAGALSFFAAPTSHGKTTLLINLALNVAHNTPDKQIYFFSYEEDGDSILINALNSYLDKDISRNNRKSIRSYFTTGSTEHIQSHSRDYFLEAKNKFFSELIYPRRLNINYSAYNSDTLIEAIRYLHKNANPAAVFIDYIQLLNLPEGKYKTYSRQEEIKEVCIALKDLAVDTGLPVILGAQFNRTVTNQLQLHPTKIGEAGDIERIANLIVGFWNNNFKPIATDSELKEIDAKGFNAPDTIYATIMKQRGGRVGLEGAFTFNGNSGRIKNKGQASNYFK